MIYSATLNLPVKRAYHDQSIQSTLSRIIENLILDPESTNMDVVILGPKDCSGSKADKLQSALDNKHPGVCVIYLYTKEAERDYIDCEFKFSTKKINEKSISAAYAKFVGGHQIRIGKGQVSSADFVSVGDEDEDEEFTDVQLTGKKESRPSLSIPDEISFDDDEFEDIGTPLNAKKAPAPEAKKAPAPEGKKAPEPKGKKAPAPKSKKAMTLNGKKAPAPPPVVLDDDDDFETYVPETEAAPVSPAPVEEEISQASEEVSSPDFSLDFDTEEEAKAPAVPMDTAPAEPPVASPSQSFEEAIAGVRSYEDWSILKENLRRDSIMSQLIIENSEFAGLQNFLSILDRRIETVWRDTTLSSEEKFDKIKEIGLEKSVARAASNSIGVDKVIKIVSTVVLSAKRTVEEKIASVNASIGKIIVDRNAMMDTQYIDKAINERISIQTELLNISADIMNLYKSVDSLLKGEMAELDKRLPSANPVINDMVKPIGTQIFTPSNTKILANKLARALQENKILASQMEESINALIDMLFELCSKDEEIIRYQQSMIDMLRVNRVEDIVVVNSALKRSLNIFVGADNTGRSATAITWSGALSRRKNCLLVDITGRAKFKNYGITPMSLDEFMVSRAEVSLLCVESDHKLNPEEVQKLLAELRARLNYYSHINVIVAPEDTDVLNQLSEEALSVNYITDCSTSSTQIMYDVVKAHTFGNIARKLIVIDTPVSPLMIADSVGVDPTQVKLITLPNMPAIRACALRYDRPYEFTDVVKAFEEAFRT